MTIRHFALTCCAAAALLIPALSAAVDAEGEKRAAILKLIEVSGGMEMGKQMGVQLVSVFADNLNRSKVPPEVIELLPKIVGDVLDATMPEYTELVVNAYDRTYTLQEIRDITAFYETPTGRRVIQTLPDLMTEMVTAGAELGKRSGPEIARRIEAELQRQESQIKM